jgi:hypothetical protein
MGLDGTEMFSEFWIQLFELFQKFWPTVFGLDLDYRRTRSAS